MLPYHIMPVSKMQFQGQRTRGWTNSLVTDGPLQLKDGSRSWSMIFCGPLAIFDMPQVDQIGSSWNVPLKVQPGKQSKPRSCSIRRTCSVPREVYPTGQLHVKHVGSPVHCLIECQSCVTDSECCRGCLCWCIMDIYGYLAPSTSYQTRPCTAICMELVLLYMLLLAYLFLRMHHPP